MNKNFADSSGCSPSVVSFWLLLISRSEFVEMFVGVGASRVRDLSDQAKQRYFYR